MNILTLFSVCYSLTIGYQSSGYNLWEQTDPYLSQTTNQSLITNFNVDLYFWNFYVGGGTNTTSAFGNDIMKPGDYNPLWNDYAFRVGYKGKYITVGYDYHCIHPVRAYLQDTDTKYTKEGGCTTLFVKFEHQLKFK